MVKSVGLSVCLSVCHTFFHYVPIILLSWNFQETDITHERSDVHATGQGQRSKVKVAVVKTQFSRFQFEITYNDIIHTAWCLGEALYRLVKVMLKNFKVINKKNVDFAQIRRFWAVTQVWNHQWVRNDVQRLNQQRRVRYLFFNVICLISTSRGTEKTPILTQIECFQSGTPAQIHPWLNLVYYCILNGEIVVICNMASSGAM